MYCVMLLTEFVDTGQEYEVYACGPFQSQQKAEEMAAAINRKIEKRFPIDWENSNAPHAWVRQMLKTRTEVYAHLSETLGGQWENGRDPQNWNDVFAETNEAHG